MALTRSTRARGRVAEALDTEKAVTFDTGAAADIASHKGRWRNSKHAWQRAATLGANAYPEFGKLQVGKIDVGLM